VSPHPGETFGRATAQRAPSRVSEATKVVAGETHMDVAGLLAGDGMPKHEGTESTIHGLAPLYFHLRHHRTRCSIVVQRGDSRTRNIRCSLSHLAILDPSELYRRTSTSIPTASPPSQRRNRTTKYARRKRQQDPQPRPPQSSIRIPVPTPLEDLTLVPRSTTTHRLLSSGRATTTTPAPSSLPLSTIQCGTLIAHRHTHSDCVALREQGERGMWSAGLGE
jgi:hypothetical protein